MTPRSDMQSFRSFLSQHARHVVALCGAGISAASGIPTFRSGAGALWRRHDAMSLATPEAFARDPSLVWQFYAHRRRVALAAKPNAAHEALGDPRLKLQAIVTQNVDGLARQVATAAPLLEMHGSILETRCCDCGHVATPDPTSDLCPALSEAVVEGTRIALADLPRCQPCGGLLRPNVVWFGEQPVHLDTIDEHLVKADLLLVVGTSSTVYPAAGFAVRARRNGAKVAVFNLEASPGDEQADWVFLGPAEETLEAALG